MSSIVKKIGEVCINGGAGVKELHETLTCFAQGQLVYTFDSASKMLKEIPIE